MSDFDLYNFNADDDSEAFYEAERDRFESLNDDYNFGEGSEDRSDGYLGDYSDDGIQPY